MLQTFRLCRFQARYQILQTQNHESDMGKKVAPKMWRLGPQTWSGEFQNMREMKIKRKIT